MHAMRGNPLIRDPLLQYVHELMIHGSQRALCVARHESERRVACWLCLACQTLDGRTLPMTQEGLSTILGLRRPGVAEILKRMEAAGLVRRTRGVLEIIDLEQLELMTCGCYSVVGDPLDSLRSSGQKGPSTAGPFARRLACDFNARSHRSERSERKLTGPS